MKKLTIFLFIALSAAIVGCAVLGVKLSDATTANEAAVASLSQELADARSACEELTAEALDLSGRLDAVTEERDALLASTETAAAENADLSAQIGTLTDENAALTTRVGTLTDENAALTTQVGTLTDENASLTTQIGTLTAENAALTSENAALLAEKEELASSHDALTAEKVSLAREVSTLTRENEELTSINEYLTQQVTSLSAQVEALSNAASGTATLSQDDVLKANDVNISAALSTRGSFMEAGELVEPGYYSGHMIADGKSDYWITILQNPGMIEIRVWNADGTLGDKPEVTTEALACLNSSLTGGSFVVDFSASSWYFRVQIEAQEKVISVETITQQIDYAVGIATECDRLLPQVQDGTLTPEEAAENFNA